MRMTPGWVVWIRRLFYAAVLVVAIIAPGRAARSGSLLCTGSGCERAGAVRWARPLPGAWIVRGGLMGITPRQGQAYAALGDQVAAVGTGLTVSGYRASTGRPLWRAVLSGFPAGSAIVSVRVWPGVVTAGVGLPGAAARKEVVLAAATGRRIRAYPSAPFGGAVAAGTAATVIVGTHAVTAYANRSGRVIWSRATGTAAQGWQVDGRSIYVTVAAGGYLGTAPVTAVRKISLRTGAQRLIRPARHAFAGTLSLVFGGVVLFSRATGITAYSASTGERLWHRAVAQPESADAVAGRLYLTAGNMLIGVDPLTGVRLTRVAGQAGRYGVRAGTVLGLDHGALGRAWGYDVATRRVLWTSVPLPWPHYFVDLSGLGGSASGNGVLLAICLRPGSASPGPQPCARPELVTLNR